nr:hypothetical protein [Bacillus safensis]MDH3095241.1 hypothetical protein [Bacillus safensis]
MSFIVLFLLYFPEDKREYIPAAITTVIFFIAAFICFRLIVRASKKQERIDEKRTKKNGLIIFFLYLQEISR